MIIVKIQGGLGNQLFQYAAGRALSLRTKSPLVLDISYYRKSINRTFALNDFHLHATVQNPNPTLTRIFKPFHTLLYHTFNEQSARFDPSILSLGKHTRLVGYFQSERYFEGIEDDLRTELTLQRPLGATAKKWTGRIDASESVSLHVRRGDYTHPKLERVHGLLPLEYYTKATMYVRGKTTKPTFFVFSDDIKWAREHLTFPYPTEFVSSHDMDPVEELSLMSRCLHHITANSSFSWWGTWLGEKANGIAIAPKSWFKDREKDSSDIIPARWITL